MSEGSGECLCAIHKERLVKAMKINVIGRQMNVYEDMKALIEKKLAKFDKFFPGEGDATVTLSCKHNEKNLEITISAGGALFRSEVRAESFRDALDGAVSNIERQIRKNKTKLARRLREGSFVPYIEDDYDDIVAEEEEIIRTKTFPAKPMSPEEAILQMNLLGHQFFLFVDDNTTQTCAVYKRHDGGYGLLVPEQE